MRVAGPVLPRLSPRLVVRAGLLSLLTGTVVLLGALYADAGPEIFTVPLLLIGLGIGALASQLGAVTVSAVPDDDSPEVGGLAEHDDEPRGLAGAPSRGRSTSNIDLTGSWRCDSCGPGDASLGAARFD